MAVKWLMTLTWDEPPRGDRTWRLHRDRGRKAALLLHSSLLFRTHTGVSSGEGISYSSAASLPASFLDERDQRKRGWRPRDWSHLTHLDLGVGGGWKAEPYACLSGGAGSHPLCILASRRCPGTPAARLSLPPPAPLSINSPGRARLGDDAARRAGGERRLCRAGGRRAPRRAPRPPCARLPVMGVTESSQGRTVHQRTCLGLRGLRGRG